ncbi:MULTISPECIES: hypothetical protein [unclassified Herbaspirillum]
MRHAVLIAVVAFAVLSTACERKDKPPKPTVSMAPVAPAVSVQT